MMIKYMNGNIADMCADAIVLPANPALKEGRGSSRVLFERAGRKKLRHFCETCVKQRGPFHTGDVIASPAFHLNAEYILHTVVPRWKDGSSDEYAHLMMTYIHALRQADFMGCRSIAFPLLASGNNGYRHDLAYQIAEEAIERFEAQNTLETVFLVLFGEGNVKMAAGRGYKVHMVKKKGYVENRSASVISPFYFEDFMNQAFALYDKVKEFDKVHPEVKQWVFSFVTGILINVVNDGKINE